MGPVFAMEMVPSRAGAMNLGMENIVTSQTQVRTSDLRIKSSLEYFDYALRIKTEHWPNLFMMYNIKSETIVFNR